VSPCACLLVCMCACEPMRMCAADVRLRVIFGGLTTRYFSCVFPSIRCSCSRRRWRSASSARTALVAPAIIDRWYGLIPPPPLPSPTPLPRRSRPSPLLPSSRPSTSVYRHMACLNDPAPAPCASPPAATPFLNPPPLPAPAASSPAASSAKTAPDPPATTDR